MSEYIVDITPENAQSEIIEASFKHPVLVDFWAEWCAPCKNLMPILEKLVEAYQGQFTLAKINADEQQMLAAQFGVRSLPTVMLVKDGQPIDGFAGAQPESEVRAMLEKHLPKPWDLDHEQAKALLAEEAFAQAASLLKQAYDTSGQRADIALSYASALIPLRRLDDAEAVLDTVKLVDQDALYEQLRSQLTLAREAGKSPEIEALERALESNPEDPALTIQLATQYAQNQFNEDALELLFTRLQADLGAGEGEVRKTFTHILQSLEKDDPAAVRYQRKLYTLLY